MLGSGNWTNCSKVPVASEEFDEFLPAIAAPDNASAEFFPAQCRILRTWVERNRSFLTQNPLALGFRLFTLLYNLCAETVIGLICLAIMDIDELIDGRSLLARLQQQSVATPGAQKPVWTGRQSGEKSSLLIIRKQRLVCPDCALFLSLYASWSSVSCYIYAELIFANPIESFDTRFLRCGTNWSPCIR